MKAEKEPAAGGSLPQKKEPAEQHTVLRMRPLPQPCRSSGVDLDVPPPNRMPPASKNPKTLTMQLLPGSLQRPGRWE